MASQSCNQSQKCKKSSYKSSDSKLKVPKLSNSEICVSSIDLRKEKKFTQKIKIDFSSGLISKLIIFTYLLPFYQVLGPNWNTGMIIIDRSNYTQFKDFQLEDTNYLVVVYYTFDENIDYAGFKLTWSSKSLTFRKKEFFLGLFSLFLL